MVLNFQPPARWLRPLDRGLARPRKLTCLLTTLHTERALSLALVQHLTQELPDVEFVRGDQPRVGMVWICGYEPGQTELIDRMRARHPEAQILVTAKAPEESWAPEVLAAGADMALAWPADLGRLSRALRRDRLPSRG